MSNVKLKLRSRNVGHAWYDKQVIRWFRQSFTKIQYKNLRNVYIALTEIDSDFGSTTINGLSNTIKKYAGISHSISTRYIHFLREVGLVKIEQQRIGAKFGPSTMSMMMWTNQSEYYQEHKQYLDSILAGEVSIRKSPLVTKVVNHKCDHNKNTKVSINKNDKSSNKLSKDNTSGSRTTVKKRIIKLKKKNPVKEKPVQSKYPLLVNQVYKELVEKGATNHRKDSKIYLYTLEQIHKLLSTRAKNPFANLQDHDVNDRQRQYSADDLVEAFVFHLEYSKKMNRKPIKSVGSFILMKGWGDKTPYSPFLIARYNKGQHDYTGATGDVKVMMRECEKLHIKFSQSQALRVMSLLEKKTKGMFIPTSLNHIYFGKPFYIFLEHLDNIARKKNLPPQVIASETFLDNFITDALFKKTLMKGNGHGAY